MAGHRGLCPRVQNLGTCHENNCSYSHNTSLFCFDCNAICPNENSLQQHLQGKRHRSSIRQATSVGYCPICNVDVPGGVANRQQHNAGARHRRNAQVSGGTMASHSFFCNVCQRAFRSKRLEQKHMGSGDHKRRLKFSSVAAVLRDSGKDKYEVTVTPEGAIMDFGFIDTSTSTTETSRTAKICVQSMSPHVQLVGVRLLSANNLAASTTFHIRAPETLPAHLLVQHALEIPIKFDPSGLRGRFVDHLELSFTNIIQQQTFLITRSLRAAVGVLADHELLRPAAPYTRPAPRAPAPKRREFLRGPKPSSRLTIPYISRLPDYPFDPACSVSGSLRQRIQAIQQLLPSQLDGTTYARHWRTLLHVEEAQMLLDMEAYDLHDVALDQHEAFFYLQVPGLAEKRPSVLVGDAVHVRLNRQPDIEYEGRVHVVREREIGLRFHARFAYRRGELCSAFFTVCRIPLRRMHFALDCPYFPDRVLFPSWEHIQGSGAPSLSQLSATTPINPLIASNPPQLLAVSAIKNLAVGSVPFTIFGPPGTGKTVTMVEAIVQILQSQPGAKILACAPSNSAADLLAQRLLHLGSRRVFRMNAPSRFYSRIPDNLKDFVFRDRDGHFSVHSADALRSFDVVVSTCLSASIPHGIGVPTGHFTHIFIDEAGQAMEPEIMVPIKTMADPSTRIILSGDPQQLGPIIRSAVAGKLGLETSFLSRIMQREIYQPEIGSGITMVKLTKNWRSHEAILRFPNEAFYSGELQVCGDTTMINSLLDSPVLATPNFPIVFHGISGSDEREAGSPSYFNIDEISEVCKYVDMLRMDRKRLLTDHDIGIISPYNAQGKKLRKRLQNQYENIKVGSVEEFQGQERKVIVLTTVRSSEDKVNDDLSHALGFLANPRRLNVALTRAKALLVIVGNPRILGLDPLWRQFLTYLHRNGGWRTDGLQPEWNLLEDASDRAADDNDAMERLAERLRAAVLSSVPQNEEDYDQRRREANEDRGPWREEE